MKKIRKHEMCIFCTWPYSVHARGSKSLQNLHVICIKTIYIRHKPITLKVLLFCTCTLAPAVLPLLEAHLEVPFMDGCETCCHFHWIHSPEAKQWHFTPILRLRKSWKSHGERCGEYCGWGWLKYSSAPKTALWGRSNKAHCNGARSISFSTVWTFFAEWNP